MYVSCCHPPVPFAWKNCNERKVTWPHESVSYLLKTSTRGTSSRQAPQILSERRNLLCRLCPQQMALAVLCCALIHLPSLSLGVHTVPAPLYTPQPGPVPGTHTPVRQVEQVNKGRARPDCDALLAEIPGCMLGACTLGACLVPGLPYGLLVSITDFMLGVELL